MSRYVNPVPQYYLNDGSVASSGKLYFYENKDPNTKKDTFSDPDNTIKNTNPVLLDGEGRCPPVFGDGLYTVALKSNQNIQQWSRDDVDLTTEPFNQFSDWEATTTYRVNEIVRASNGNYYISIVNNNVGNDPVSSPTVWEEIVFLTIWNSSATYDQDDIVIHSGSLYRSVIDDNENNQPDESSTNTWADTSEPRDWLATRTYNTGDLVVHNQAIWASTIDSNLNSEPGLNSDWRDLSSERNRVELTGASSTIDSGFNNTYFFTGASDHALTIDEQLADEGATETKIICDPSATANIILSLGGVVSAGWSFSPSASISGYEVKPGETVRLVNTGDKDTYLVYADNGISDKVDLDGSFDASQSIRMSRNGNIVTITTDGTVTHSSTNSPASAAVIPAVYRPNDLIPNLYFFNTSGVREVRVSASGVLSLVYLDWGGMGAPDTSSGAVVHITYDVLNF